MANEIATKQPQTMEEYVESVISSVAEKVSSRGIAMPKNFALSNGLNAAMLAIQQTVDKDGKPALQVCTPESIKQFLLNVVQNGLYANKTHFYPVVFGNKLTMLTSYLGEIWKMKQNDTTIKNVYSEVLYDGDVFKFRIVNGHKEVTLHEQDIDNIKPEKIRGAYAVVEYVDGSTQAEYMPLAEIKKSWQYGQSKGESKAHKLSTSEMCKKTVLRRLAKQINAINNDALFEEELEDAEQHIDEQQNNGVIDITPEEYSPLFIEDTNDQIESDDEEDEPIDARTESEVWNDMAKVPRIQYDFDKPNTVDELEQVSIDDPFSGL